MKNSVFAVFKNGRSWLVASGAALVAVGMVPDNVSAHGFVGDYFFPPTITTDDPFATDEFSFPTVSWFKADGVATTDISFEFDKEIFPKFTLGIAGDYLFQRPEGGPGTSGWDDFVASAKYQLWENAPHQAILSVGAEWQIGGSGSSEVGADSTHVLTPTIYYGKAFGDLPDALNYAKPLAVTGTLGLDLPTRAEPNNLQWGFAVEYSLTYLQQEVKDIGLPAPFKTMIPLVEFSMTSPLNRGGGQTTGTINPGVLYGNPHFQIGAEALIPVNSVSGHTVGFVVQVQWFIDDLWPKVFGHPIFGSR
ncbi:MAG TPA: hypothetical protein VH280_22670 [Verrucomicrobiae bacterium]|jgi:hypothetical protein|nr:hypothetical protein [Verrucomicrobiae bacterium]